MSTPLVVVSAGTYHLPFHRLTDWMRPWASAHPEVRVVMQHGPSRPLPGAENHRLLPYAQLLELCAEADAIVLQGGAGGVMDMRTLGRIPIVVPRVPFDDEVVDDHQLIFTERVAQLGVIHRVTTRSDLHTAVDAALAGAIPTRLDHTDVMPGARRLEDELVRLPEALGRRAQRRRLARAFRGVIRSRR